MQMEHGLAGLGTAVDHRAPGREPLLAGHLGGHQQQVAEQGSIGGAGVGQVHQGLARNHQEVYRGLGLDIAEGDAEVVAVDLIRGDLAPQDAAKNRVCGLVHGGGDGTDGSGPGGA